MNIRVATANPVKGVSGVAAALLALTKPGVTRLVIATTLFGAVLVPGPLEFAPALWTVAGTLLVVGSANALNMVLEHDVDAKMTRTQDRPLPAGQLSIEVALVFGLCLGALGLGVLWLGVNDLTGMLAALALISYVLIYTPMKGMTPLSLLVGSIPGAAPPLLGYTGVAGHTNLEAWSLFAVLFAWQIPHFLAISVFRQHEYQAAGLKVMPGVYGMKATQLAIVVSSFVLVGVTSLPTLAGLGGPLYNAVAAFSGLGFALWALCGRGWLKRRVKAYALPNAEPELLERWARITFFASMPYLVLLFAALIASV
ncbi:MAG: hypothetical protein RJA70_4269 [Pseudomonadota bacterium]|jgi:protoheme IX farnesyltransferase